MLILCHYENLLLTIYYFFMCIVHYFAVNSLEFSLDVEDYLVGECP